MCAIARAQDSGPETSTGSLPALGVDTQRHTRPRLVVSAGFAAVNAATSAWLAGEMRGNLHKLIDEAFDVFDQGLADVR